MSVSECWWHGAKLAQATQQLVLLQSYCSPAGHSLVVVVGAEVGVEVGAARRKHSARSRRATQRHTSAYQLPVRAKDHMHVTGLGAWPSLQQVAVRAAGLDICTPTETASC